MGSPCLFTRQQALKMGYFYWLRVKSLNHLQTELNLGYLKGTKFCLESKASFIDISSIASFKPFLIAWLLHYFSFSDSSVASHADVLRLVTRCLLNGRATSVHWRLAFVSKEPIHCSVKMLTSLLFAFPAVC